MCLKFCFFFVVVIICKLMTRLPGSARPNSYMEFMQIITVHANHYLLHFGFGVNFEKQFAITVPG